MAGMKKRRKGYTIFRALKTGGHLLVLGGSFLGAFRVLEDLGPTAGSAGYDFFLTLPIVLRPGESIKVPTGIRARMDVNWVLQIYPRSGLGFKYRLQMNNTVGIIDSDYFYSDNEGHIFIKILNDSREEKTLELAEGMAFAQGIFMEYGITEDDDVTESRNGGFGSTDGNK